MGVFFGQINPIFNIFLLSYIPSMAWDIEYTDEFGQWWNSLTESEQILKQEGLLDG